MEDGKVVAEGGKQGEDSVRSTVLLDGNVFREKYYAALAALDMIAEAISLEEMRGCLATYAKADEEIAALRARLSALEDAVRPVKDRWLARGMVMSLELDAVCVALEAE